MRNFRDQKKIEMFSVSGKKPTHAIAPTYLDCHGTCGKKTKHRAYATRWDYITIRVCSKCGDKRTVKSR